MARSRPRSDIPGDGHSKNLVDRRVETGLMFRNQKNERIRDQKAKAAIRYAVRRKGYLNKTEGVKSQRKQDEAMKEAARRRLMKS